MAIPPNQTNVNLTTIFPNLGGGSNSPQTSEFSSISVSSINVNAQGYIEMFNNPSNESGRIIGYSDVNNSSSISILVSFVSGYASKVNGTNGLWCIENDAAGANQAYGDFGAGRLAVLGNNSGTSIPVPVLDSDGNGRLELQAVSTINFSTPTLFLNGAPIVGKMNWGAVAIPASGSTIASIADNPYSGEYYQQLTYRGNVQAGLSSLFASSINGESFFIYGEPGQQVMFHTIGDA